MTYRKYTLARLIFLLLHIGLVAELSLLGHYASFWQIVPLVCLGLGLVSLFLSGASSGSLLLVKFFYSATILSGILGVFLHLKNNWEFELEMYPGADTGSLIVQTLSGAIPALAPATLIPIGLMGFLLLQLKNEK